MARAGDGASGTQRPDRAGEHDVELAKVHRSHEVRSRLAQGLVGALWIAAASIPIWALGAVIEPLAGETTVVKANLIIGGGLALSVIINVSLFFKGRSQREEIKRLRARADRLEKKALE